jgi:hypothetical protein
MPISRSTLAPSVGHDAIQAEGCEDEGNRGERHQEKSDLRPQTIGGARLQPADQQVGLRSASACMLLDLVSNAPT